MEDRRRNPALFPARLFERDDYLICILLFVVVFIIYCGTAAPDVTLVDSGELILSAKHFAPGHPPGFPLYVMTAGLCANLPFARPARLVNLFSSLCGALAVSVLFLVVLHFCRTVRLKRRHSNERSSISSSIYGTKRNRIHERTAAATAALLFGFSTVMWFQTTVAEVYALNVLLFSLGFLFIFRSHESFLRWTPGPSDYTGFFFIGLGLAVHNVTFIMALPAIVYILYVPRIGRKLFTRNTLFLIASVVLPAIAMYGFLMWRASTDPLFNWGNPDTVTRLFRHFRGKQYSSYIFQYSKGYFSSETLRILSHLFLEYTPLGIPLIAWGGMVLRKTDRHAFRALLLIGGFSLLYAFAYEIAEDKEAYYLSVFWTGSVLFGIGISNLFESYSRKTKIRWKYAFLTLLLLPAIMCIVHFPPCNHRNDLRANRVLSDLTAPMEENSLLLTKEWQIYSPWLYRTHVENYRGDLAIIDINLLRRTWYFDYLDRAYPDLMTAVKREREAFMDHLVRFENGLPYDSSLIQRTFLDLIERFIEVTIEDHAVYMTPPFEPDVGAEYLKIPWGLAFRLFAPQNPPLDLPALQVNEGIRWVYFDDDLGGKKVRWLYAVMLHQRSLFYKNTGRTAEYDALRRRIEKLAPRNGESALPYPGMQ
jgi:hypothetical protein